MIRLLMLLYMILLAQEKRSRTKKVVDLLGFASSGWQRQPRPKAIVKPEPVKGLREQVTKLSELEPVPEPTTLVGWEARAAVKLQAPVSPVRRDFIYIQSPEECFDTPIGRTLTEEFIRRDPLRCPSAAVAHLPVNDAAREKLARAAERTSEHPKGRATPKRPRKVGH